MARIPQETIEQIFSASRIEEVIGEFVDLKKSGSNLKGLSPFNNEKSPSFMVSPAKQIFKCFSSGKGGNAVTFLMELEQLSYPEALRWIAKKYNIEVPDARPQTSEEIEAGNMREAVYLITEVASKFYADQMLNTDTGRAIGLSYFKERGFTDETIAKFQLGYSPEQSTAFADYALKNQYSEKALEASGISMKNDRGWYDRFRGRVMFPIHSVSGRVLGFGGRILQSNVKAAKYLNSPENPIYHKSKVLYGLFQGKQEIVKRNEAFLVEGYTDVLSFFQNGVQNVVSSSGTALTEGQISMIKRYTPNITLLFDGDAAGIRASFRGLDMMLEQGVNVRVVSFPDGEDPDSFAQRHTQTELKTFLAAERKDFISFKTGILMGDAAGDPLKRAEMIKDIVASIAKVPNSISQEVFIKEASKILDVDPRALYDELNRLLGVQERIAKKKQADAPPMEVLPPEAAPETRVHGYVQEERLIHLLIAKGTSAMLEEGLEEEDDAVPITIAEWAIDEIEDDGIAFVTPVFAKIYAMLLEEVDGEHVPEHDWWVRQEDPEVIAVVTEALTEKYTLANWEAKEIYLPKEKNTMFPLVKETTFRFKYIHVERKMMELKSYLGQENVDMVYYLNEFSKWNNLRQLINEQLNRVV
ncbi:MAG: DNA primase [Cryomorphaceae bacterium]|nr:MAG: DNA primase [Cryomorphaceae bacterium]